MNPRALTIAAAPGVYEVHDANGRPIGLLYRLNAGAWVATSRYGIPTRDRFATQRAAIAYVLSR